MDPKVVAQNIPGDATRTVKACPVIVDRNVSNSSSSGSYNSLTFSPAARTNPTVLPDSFLKSMIPLVLFRHPALMIPSFYRAAQKAKLEISIYDEDWPVNASLRLLRLVYDWYVKNATGKSATSIIVIDSDDLINSPGFASHLCARLGIDEQHLQTSWEPRTEAYRADKRPGDNSFHSTLWDSRGIIRGKRRDFEIEIPVEQEKLREEFGDEVGNSMARYIDLAMEDYKYLRERRFH
ncbi:MAG: hypothetical protein L6R38_002506 [Xanthoria sp. 2 TBL-2021]|nr:MAG: hypothetical protein L6R38_002506 [Xanthoria sp. 2 TBL-2021]